MPSKEEIIEELSFVRDFIEARAIMCTPGGKGQARLMQARNACEGAMKLLKEPPVIHCKDCANCFSLEAVDPMRPYDGSGDGSFYCAAFDMDFYAPRYNAATYFCADAE